MVLELLFRDGTTYPTIDFGYRSAAEAKVDEFNRYLRGEGPPELTLDSGAVLPGFLAFRHGIPIFFVLVLLQIGFIRRSRASGGAPARDSSKES